ncbi:uncharacterized protein EI90DRAFT_3137797 [Cantharellus anzutake]|uniref:uncharacterized protein n=1 Tax=Cantharellus anzutake TaxID=1750568 RepID=UPI001907213B|nr:uncharacterized protein EI90DRAFT_3137797 [Cantharellus anzutake]KAF8311915.1 hypothetical protein EI90DRAFT_3137797 [Cantharellus anzutake]
MVQMLPGALEPPECSGPGDLALVACPIFVMQRVVGLLAAGGDVLTAVNAASELYDFPLKFRGNKEEWESFGKCVADAMVDVVAGIDLCNASNEEVKLRMESVTKLSE